jgi:hypothetical protein
MKRDSQKAKARIISVIAIIKLIPQKFKRMVITSAAFSSRAIIMQAL